MLVELDIHNFATIKDLQLKFAPRMTILLGETGAGKSILIDAVSLLMGRRAQSEFVRSGEQKATVTGLFTLQASQMQPVKALCEEYGLPLDGDDLIISRQISAKGRNIIRINGQLTTITALKKFSLFLVDIHGQGSNQLLMNQDLQIDLVDHYAGADFAKLLAKYHAKYQAWANAKRQLKNLREHSQELAQKHDILQFQKEELTNANLTDLHEDDELEDEFTKLDNFQKIAQTASYLTQLFDDEEHGLSALLDSAQTAAEELAQYGNDFKDMQRTLDDGAYALNDARSELGDIVDQLDFDPERLQEVSGRLDLLNNLKKKYGPTLADVQRFHEQVQADLDNFEAGGSNEDALVKQIQELEKAMAKLAAQIHAQRQQTAAVLTDKIKQELTDLYMEKARFAIRFRESSTFLPQGTDQLAFYIAPNPGEELMPLVKIVSGGEQSRLLLALKAIFSQVEPVGTMIFDEIDTGVSGRVSAAIGQKMRAIGREKQVIAITHAPQVAAAADHRKQIVKLVKAGQTFTQVNDLDQAASVQAIAQMIAGKNVTVAAKQNAADLLARSAAAK
ncbi:MAG: DNA repair protein RecN [Lactobacillus sp.]|jgi:DNA repair protein RecN (Recombination protein N)|nr:DNA repair protein RecN [Lactobacillus sp.]